MSKPGDRVVVWAVAAAVAGVVLLGLAGAPQSVDFLLWTGIDSPHAVGAQLAVAVSGAVATAVAVVLARWWRWALVAGAVGVAVALAVDAPPSGGLSVRLRGATPSGELAMSAGWACVLAAAAGVLLVGVLGAVQRLMSERPRYAVLAGVAACAGYFGVSVTGILRGVDPAVPAVGMALVTVGAALRAGGGATWGRTRPVAAVIVLLTAVPTAVVALRGAEILGTEVGGVVGVLLAAAAIAGGGRDWAFVGALGAVLAAPVPMLVLLHSTATGEVWYAWPIALAGVLAGAVAATRVAWAAPPVVAVAALPVAAMASQIGGKDFGVPLAWIFLGLATAAVAAVGAVSATAFPDLPSLGALATTAAVGVSHALGFVRSGPDGALDLDNVVGPAGQGVSAVLLLAGAALLVLSTVRQREPVTV
ncbi:hypothetical protein [Actinokineospora iranica]|uniref:Uncharacterized protein n=1 Tax=Actinokineospora iranica TaxID=1271860 RepID=A0A1G6WML1_9PSEU|nr:hypothetical protein [Actinokineospora iranica]SDD67051.1 hypothetical protein SAMN05216174_11585 [Actinokineospora iranica]